MTPQYIMTSLAVLVLAAFILNLPFGYLRGKTRKFSFQWFLYIHLPIPAIFLMRTFAGIGITFVPVIAIGAVMGQFLGGRLYNNLKAL